MPLRPNMGLREYGALFLRRKWLIVFSFLGVVLAGSVYCVVAPERYKSSTTARNEKTISHFLRRNSVP